MNELSLARVEALLRHFDAGLSIRATAEVTGTAKDTVMRYHRMWRQARRQGAAEACGRLVVGRLSVRAAESLEQAAAARGRPRNGLAMEILEAIAGDGLVGAVLD